LPEETVPRLIKAAILLAICFFFLFPSQLSSQSQVSGRNDTLAFVRDFLAFFYPGVMKKGNQLVVGISHPADSSWQEIHGVYFKVIPFTGNEPNPLADGETKTTLLKGIFWLSPKPRYDRVLQLIISSEAVRGDELASFRHLVESHPEWTSEQCIQALKSAGAHYGPDQKEEFLKAIRLNQAERFLGKITVRSVEFNGPGSASDRMISESSFQWTIVADTEFPDGSHSQCTLTFEPFEGRLKFLSSP
jgi:hypothetical protein